MPSGTRNRREFCAWVPVALAIITVLVISASAAGTTYKQHRKVANEMATRGCLGEARWRWEQMLLETPNNPALLNNLAVAAEARGDLVLAQDYYSRAYALAGMNDRISTNWRAFVRAHPELGTYTVAENVDPVPLKGNTRQVPVSVVVRPRVETGEMESVLVTAFRVDDTSMMGDINWESVYYMREELRKHTRLAVDPTRPPPPVPEQMLERLVRNYEFWAFLGEQYDADLVLFCVIRFARRDDSRYQEVEHKDQTTGQTSKRVVYVQREEFTLTMTLCFFDGRSGALLDMNRYQRFLTFAGEMNDPITAFYELMQPAGVEMLVTVIPHWRIETRHIFRSW